MTPCRREEKSMADLLDIAPSTAVEVVKIDGLRVKVRGVSVDAIASIVARFPELKLLASGSSGDSFLPRLIQGCGAAVGPIIAAGCGHLANESYEQHAAMLLPEHQMKFLKAIFGLTFPNGIGSFVEELTGLIGGAGEGAKPVKIRLRKSPSPSSPSDEADSLPTLQ
jgi:hypothetical protein